MRKPLDVYAIMQNIPDIMGMSDLVLKNTSSGAKWQGRYYINGAPHPWKRDKLRIWAYNGNVIVGEQGGDVMSIQKWLVEYGHCADFHEAYDVLNGSRVSLGRDIKLIADRERGGVGKYVHADSYASYEGYSLDTCNLYNVFSRMFSSDTARDVFKRYRVTSDERGNVVYWYVDVDGNICHDKVMRYKYDGHRDKAGGGWRKFTTSDGYTNRCYFGAHLLGKLALCKLTIVDKDCGYSGSAIINRDVYVVEGEKTAMLCSVIWPDDIFIATGGKNQLRDIDPDWVLLPDIDAIEEWGERGRISRWWEMFPDVGEHDDIGDMIERCVRAMDIGYLKGNSNYILNNI